MIRTGLIVCAALTTTGCASISGFTPTMASDPPYTGAEGRVFQTELMAALQPVTDKTLLDLCQKMVPSFQERSSTQLSRYKRSRGALRSEYPFGCYKYKNVSQNGEEVRNHIVSGMALTDYYCDIFFNRIAERAAKRHFARGGVNDVGAAMSAILGLAAAGSGVTGGVGAGFGLLDSSIRNYDEAFTVDADLPALQKLVRSEQDEIRANLFDQDDSNGKEPKTYQEAAIAIMRYANTCSFTGMRGLLTASMIEKAQTQSNPMDGTRIFDFSTLTPKQRAAMIEFIKAQDELAAADEETQDAGEQGADTP